MSYPQSPKKNNSVIMSYPQVFRHYEAGHQKRFRPRDGTTFGALPHNDELFRHYSPDNSVIMGYPQVFRHYEAGHQKRFRPRDGTTFGALPHNDELFCHELPAGIPSL